MKFKNITTHYLDNNPHGVRLLLIEGSVIQAIVIPRESLKDAKPLADELPRRGVYILVDGKEGKDLPKMYVGQTQNGINRLYDHKAKKDFWTLAVMFVAKDEHFHLDIISALEKVAIKSVVKSGRYESDNKADPKYQISIFQRQVLEGYLGDIKFIMATLGWPVDELEEKAQGMWHTTRNGITAYGDYSEGRFDVLPGSQIDFSREVDLASYQELRKSLLRSGKIVEEKKGVFILQKVVTFKTPSGASDFVLGGSTNGWAEWKNSLGAKLDILRK